MLLRVLAFFILLFSVLFLPFWVSALLALAGMIYFAFFWEAVALLLLSRLLFGIAGEKKFLSVFIFLVVFIILLLAIEAFKKKIKFYK